jgi:hypothetical protein
MSDPSPFPHAGIRAAVQAIKDAKLKDLTDGIHRLGAAWMDAGPGDRVAINRVVRDRSNQQMHLYAGLNEILDLALRNMKNAGFNNKLVQVRVRHLLWSAGKMSGINNEWWTDKDGPPPELSLSTNDGDAFRRYEALSGIVDEDLAALRAVAEAIVSLGAKDETQKRGGVSKIALAIAIKSEHPEWTDIEVAEGADCHPKSLCRSPRYRMVKEAIRNVGLRSLPRGRKGKDGELEGWDQGD